MSLFTRLPSELIHTILDNLDPTSFYLCLQTSKVFRKHAAASTKLLRDQLSRIPGQRILPAHATYTANDATELIKLFGSRAMQHLASGTESMSDRKMWSTGADRQVHRKTSQLMLLDGIRMCDQIIMLFEVLGDATVNIYIAQDREEDTLDNDNGKREAKALKPEIVPRLKYIVSTDGLSKYLPECRIHGGQHEVVKVALCNRTLKTEYLMLGVLYRRKRSACECERTKINMRLLLFNLDSSFGPIVIHSLDIVDGEPGIVVAMGLTRSMEALIVMKHPEKDAYRVLTYITKKDENSLEHRTVVDRNILPGISNPHERVSSISVSNTMANLYPTSFPMPHWSASLFSISNPPEPHGIERRDTTLPDTTEVFQKHSLGRAISWNHHHVPTHPIMDDGEPTCVNTALELVISNDDCITGSRKGAFLLKAIHCPGACVGFELGSDYSLLQHLYVAELAGLPQLDNLSTLGLIVAVSFSAHRIAIASWRTLKVWSLEPRAFLDPEHSLAGAAGVPDDDCFIKNCGWSYYSSEPIDRNCVMLSPVELPSSAVIFGLEFRGEDELWGWTEAGLCRWNFGPEAMGRREVVFLDGA